MQLLVLTLVLFLLLDYKRSVVILHSKSNYLIGLKPQFWFWMISEV